MSMTIQTVPSQPRSASDSRRAAGGYTALKR